MILFSTSIICDDEEIRGKLRKLDSYLYQVEDKVDHLLYHHGHDVTKHAAQFTPWGFTYVPQPKNPHSIHHKLKIVDYMQHHINNPYMMGMNNPFMNQMMTPYNLGFGAQTFANQMASVKSDTNTAI